MKTDYTRERKAITCNATKEGVIYDSINKAKKESRRLQSTGKSVGVVK